MGKGTDKLYITHSEWSSGDRFSASSGAGTRDSNLAHSSFKRLPFNFCSLSLQPFTEPVCTATGQIFDHENIIRWLMKHDNTHPLVTGQKLRPSDLIKLQFTRNDDGDFVDPVTFKVFTDNSHVVAVRHGESANVFGYDTVERLNIKAKNWVDLLTDEPFTRGDIITLQDPLNLESRDLSSFKYLKDGEEADVMPKDEPGINQEALGGKAAKIARAKEVVAKARAEKAAGIEPASTNTAIQKSNSSSTTQPTQKPKATPYNASHHTSGLAAASFTSTGVTPNTSGALTILSDEAYLLRPRRVKSPSYVRLETTLGNLTLELLPEFAPRAVWNFVHLSRKGYYDGIIFHRNIRNFMVQGGDPTGTGKGGASIWGKNFPDEFEGPMKCSERGIVAMANKGKDTNGSQFFVLYKGAKHLDRKHTVFGRVVLDDNGGEGSETLRKMEDVPVDKESNRPEVDIVIRRAVVLVDSVEEFRVRMKGEQEAEKTSGAGADEAGDEDLTTTWTGKRVRTGVGNSDVGGEMGVGKYLKARSLQDDGEHGNRDTVAGGFMEESEPVRKKVKGGGGGFGNFDGW